MILKGAQRGGARQLAMHLIRTDENDHVEIQELRGFVAEDLEGALKEVQAIARGTRCRQFLFSLSLNPPETEKTDGEAFKKAIDRIEARLGLQGQPRAIVFHEKEGRRHAHCVWSRIDGERMTAINLPHFKYKLRDISRALYIEHGWKMPQGLVQSEVRDPANFTLAEWQQARRAQASPAALKALFQECWAASDTGSAFARALAERGLVLARGDRRGVVAVDYRGEVFAVAKWTGKKTKEVRAKVGREADLPGVYEARSEIARRMSGIIARYVQQVEAALQGQTEAIARRRLQLVSRQRRERDRFLDSQEQRRTEEAAERAERFRRGLLGFWDRLTGRHARTRAENEEQAAIAAKRDALEKERLVDRQLEERRAIQSNLQEMRARHMAEVAQLRQEALHYAGLSRESNEATPSTEREIAPEAGRAQPEPAVQPNSRAGAEAEP